MARGWAGRSIPPGWGRRRLVGMDALLLILVLALGAYLLYALVKAERF